MFTGSGHIVNVIDADEDGFYVADSSTVARNHMGGASGQEGWEDFVHNHKFPYGGSENGYPYNFGTVWVIRKK
jgi:hypothetical protein